MEDSDFSNLLARASHFLSIHDYTNCRIHALTALKAKPDHPSPIQLLAISGVLLAAKRRLPDGRVDWYSILQALEHDNNHSPEQRQQVDSPSLLHRQFAKLVYILNPWKNAYPFSQNALQFVFDAWGVLSDSEKKTQHDSGKDYDNGSYVCNDVNTFWTKCPYCYYVYEYDGMYKGCCLKCQNCARGFHTVEISPPVADCLVEVDGVVLGYKCGFGYFDVTCKGGDSVCVNQKESESVCKKREREHAVVEISDDDDDEEVENVIEKINVEKPRVSGGVGNGVEKKRRMKKAIGLNCTKIWGRGVRYGANSVAMMKELNKDNQKEGCGGESKGKVGVQTEKEAIGSSSIPGFDDGVFDDILELDLEEIYFSGKKAIGSSSIPSNGVFDDILELDLEKMIYF